jgi:hypothetical protein
LGHERHLLPARFLADARRPCDIHRRVTLTMLASSLI